MDLFIFWPQFWGTTVAHLPLLGYGLILLLLPALVLAFGDSKTFFKSFYVICLSLAFQIVFLFVYSGVRSPIYLLVFQPFFVFLTGWIVLNFYRANNYLGMGLLLMIILISVPANRLIIENNGSQVSDIMEIKKRIDSVNSGPLKLVADDNSAMIGLPLYYLYLKENRISDTGREIIACENRILKDERGIDSRWSCPNDMPILFETKRYKVYESEKLSQDQLKNFSVSPIDAAKIYHSLYDNYASAN